MRLVEKGRRGKGTNEWNMQEVWPDTSWSSQWNEMQHSQQKLTSTTVLRQAIPRLLKIAYRFFNPQTLQVIYSRDVVWMEWHSRVTATEDLSLFKEIENMRQTTHLVSPDVVKTDDGGHNTESISEDSEELSVVRDHPMVPLEEVAICNAGAVEDPPGRDDNPAPAFGPPARRRLYIPNPEARMTRV